MTVWFACIGGIIALVPGASFLLITMEVFLIYKIASKHSAFDLIHFLIASAALVTVSIVLKSLASFLHVIPVVGQLANGIVACAFILAVGNLAEEHYSKRRGNHQAGELT